MIETKWILSPEKQKEWDDILIDPEYLPSFIYRPSDPYTEPLIKDVKVGYVFGKNGMWQYRPKDFSLDKDPKSRGRWKSFRRMRAKVNGKSEVRILNGSWIVNLRKPKKRVSCRKLNC